ncbi:glycoprotein-N-acetylgalactosamine 3-beta-galactosyltransferase 1-like isoform X1 [Bactrocera tryoni]|uniref:glycoprotein-N-acetylgalactosamine 3-beta-galactosyltransferase 1-like isoform X1 n=1 Tax=Bactrocera tryoni TaxID=59916 RepID=UPI001A98DC5E|nr:glycoprotein-N-acetylgalactosamine 3-beta-galactosyltransferase 1-like isoform X1 [Bactrocera tryoni]
MKGGWTYVFAAAAVYVGVKLKKITLHLRVKFPNMFFRNVVCLLIGLIVGVRLTDFWDYVKLQQLSSNVRLNYTNLTQSLTSAQDAEALPEFLFNNTRVLCWIMTMPENHLKRAVHIRNTWGKRCNKLLFMSTKADSFLDTVVLDVPEGRDYLWYKTRAAFKYIYEHHADEADWFLKADDDSYFIMENLRAFLYQFSPDAPVYFGCKFHPFVKQGYMSGGAGYVLSRAALRRFAEVAAANSTACSQNQLSEDKEMGICLQNAGVVAGDARDDEGAERFHPLAPIHLIPVDTSEWYPLYLFYKRDKNLQCCSRSAISFHYIKPKEFYVLEYFLYELRPFGVGNVAHTLPAKANMSVLMKKWQHELSNNIFKDED